MKTYNFIEACNSGKKFKFKKNPDWHKEIDYKKPDCWFHFLHGVFSDEVKLDIINGEFILEEKKIPCPLKALRFL